MLKKELIYCPSLLEEIEAAQNLQSLKKKTCFCVKDEIKSVFVTLLLDLWKN